MAVQRVGGVRLSLWRAAVGYRIATALLCTYLIVRWHDLYARPSVAYLALAGIVLVTAVIGWLGLSGRAHRLDLNLADWAATAVLTLLTLWAQTPDQRHGGMVTLTTVWAAGATIGVGFVTGWVGGLVAGLAQFGVSVAIRDGWDGRTLLNGVLLALVGVVAGYLLRRTRQNELALAEATALAAAATERERLARNIHDGVLQMLGLVHRKGAAAGGDWAELGAAAAKQEAALRALITQQAIADPTASLGAALVAMRSDRVTVSVPAQEPAAPPHVRAEVVAAVLAALHNVKHHAGPDARAWVLLEDLGESLAVTVRDDGVGMAPGRLAEAASDGRIGVARSIRGRIEDLGGTVRITTAPGEGTEVEFSIPLDADGHRTGSTVTA